MRSIKRRALLTQLKDACLTGDAACILSAPEVLLEWLTDPGNNTDKNCRAVDIYVYTEIWQLLPKNLAEDIGQLLYDVGGQLHDTHRAREVAEKFDSTPEQLLARTRRLIAGLG
jgi:hypothetical protein